MGYGLRFVHSQMSSAPPTPTVFLRLCVCGKIPLQILQDSCSKSCKTLLWFLHARLCTVHILHGSKTCKKSCKKSCKGRLARLLQGLVRLWPLLLQYARFLSKYIRFSCKMCQILMQASLQASCKSLMYGYQPLFPQQRRPCFKINTC